MATLPTRDQIIAKAKATAAQYGLDPARFTSQLHQESGGFDPKVLSHERKSSAGAFGVAQFMPNTGKGYGLKPGEVDVMKEIDAAGQYMSKLKGMFGDQRTAEQAYNAGPGTVQQVLAGKREFKDETKNYGPAIDKRVGMYGGQTDAPRPGLLGKPKFLDAMPTDLKPRQPSPASGMVEDPSIPQQIAEAPPMEYTDPSTMSPEQRIGALPDWRDRARMHAIVADGDRARRDQIHALLGGDSGDDPAHSDLPMEVQAALDGIIDSV